jgi:hypothetical protein
MTRIVIPGSPEYAALFDGFAHSAFRWEARQEYEDEAIGAFLAGEPKPPMPGKERWVARVRSACAAGKVIARVHYVRAPLTDYLRYEITWSYPSNVDAGEDVRITTDSLGLPDRDFWLFDSTTLLWMDYDNNGCMVGAELDDNPVAVIRANAWRDAAMHAGIKLSDYLREFRAA